MYFDHRDIAYNTKDLFKSIDENTMTATVEIDYDDEYIEEKLSKEAFELIDEDRCITLPIKFNICQTCVGSGKHINPSIDSHGITYEEWNNEWDDEMREMYFDGRFSVVCYECNGNRVVPEIDLSRVLPIYKDILELIECKRSEDMLYTRMCMMERLMGA